MSNKLKRNNHFIPQMILKNFTNKNGKIFEFLVKEKQWYLPNGKQTDGAMGTFGVGKEKDIYIQKDDKGNLFDGIENAFQQIETDATPVINKIISYKTDLLFTNLSNILNMEEIDILTVFLTFGWLRTPQKFDEAAQTVSGTSLILFHQYLIEENVELPSEKLTLEYLLKNLEVSVNNQGIIHSLFGDEDFLSELIGHFSVYDWVLVNNKTKEDFLMGDCFLSFKDKSIQQDNIVYVPLSNRMALLGSNVLQFDVVKLNKNKKYNKLIKEFNIHSVKNSKNSVFSSKKSFFLKRFILKNVSQKEISIKIGQSEDTHIPKYKRINEKGSQNPRKVNKKYEQHNQKPIGFIKKINKELKRLFYIITQNFY